MASDASYHRLLGLAHLRPPEGLARGSRFNSAKGYQDFLDRTQSDPAAYWQDLAEDFAWTVRPSGVGGPGDWFPDGRLNLCAAALDTWIGAGQGEQRALVSLDGQSFIHLSRQALLSRVGAMGEHLASMGLEAGERVLMALPRGAELLCAVLAGLRAGLTCVPIDPVLGDPDRVNRRASATGCKAALTARAVLDDGCLPDFARLPVTARTVLEPGWETVESAPVEPVPVKSMQAAFLLADKAGRVFGLPTAGLALAGISAYRHLLDGRGTGDLHWFQTPAHHAAFLSGSLGTLMEGGCLATPLTGSLEDPGLLRDALERVRPRVMLIQAKILERALTGWRERSEAPLSGFAPALVIIDGAAVAPSFYMAVRTELFGGRSHLVQVLSRPEAGGFVAGPQPALCPVRPACAGLTAPGYDLLVLDSKGEASARNHGGLLACAQVPPSLAVELQRRTVPVTLGLKARRDAAGDLWSVAEAHVDLPEQTRVPSTEVEAFIASLPGVARAAVVVAKDASGQVHTRAFVEATGEKLDLDEIARTVSEHLGPDAVPQTIQPVTALPVSRSGKLQRSLLKRVAIGDTDGLLEMEPVCDPAILRELITERR